MLWEFFQEGYKGFYSKNTMRLTPKVVSDIHKLGGTFLRTSRGGHDTHKIVDNIEDRGINQVVKNFSKFCRFRFLIDYGKPMGNLICAY